jgi:hypothetical protein
MTLDEKGKLARKLTHALHQAPGNPELFTNIMKNAVAAAGIHMTDLSITIGDLTIRLAEQLRDAKRDAKPTYDTLTDMAGTKINFGTRPERALAEVLGVTVKNIEDHKRHGRVPRMWLDKIRALPDLDETSTDFDAETQRVIELLAENGYSAATIQDCFRRIRTSRAGLRQIEKIVHGSVGPLAEEELGQMQCNLFSAAHDADPRFAIWVATQLRTDTNAAVTAVNAKQAEKLRIRFKREIEMRQSDPAYRRVAKAAELIQRPQRSGARSPGSDRFSESSRFRVRLDRLFGDEAPDRRNRRLAQLTGLDERHTLDLLNGANAVNEVWWKFLGDVEAAVTGTKVEPVRNEQTPPAGAMELSPNLGDGKGQTAAARLIPAVSQDANGRLQGGRG